jgi:hypothetical protein
MLSLATLDDVPSRHPETCLKKMDGSCRRSMFVVRPTEGERYCLKKSEVWTLNREVSVKEHLLS